MELDLKGDNFAAQRERMVGTQLADRGIHDLRVLAAMRNVPRHEFVPENLQADPATCEQDLTTGGTEEHRASPDWFSPVALCVAWGEGLELDLKGDNFAAQRERMVGTQLADRGIHDLRVLAAMRDVPRHEFVPEKLQGDAYEDRPLPIGEGQTISQPYIVAAMLEHLALRASDRVLEIGTGSGYVTALLSLLCAEVYSMERHARLAAAAESALHRLEYRNVKIRVGDGHEGWAEFAPFDAILVSAATAEIPPALFAQLREGGRMMVPIGPSSSQELQLIRKVSRQTEVKILEGCRFVPLVEGTADRS